MRYAILNDNTVVNIIILNHASDINDSAIFVGDLPVAVGDLYSDNNFYRDGKIVVESVNEKIINNIIDDYTMSLIEEGVIK